MLSTNTRRTRHMRNACSRGSSAQDTEPVANGRYPTTKSTTQQGGGDEADGRVAHTTKPTSWPVVVAQRLRYFFLFLKFVRLARKSRFLTTRTGGEVRGGLREGSCSSLHLRMLSASCLRELGCLGDCSCPASTRSHVCCGVFLHSCSTSPEEKKISLCIPRAGSKLF